MIVVIVVSNGATSLAVIMTCMRIGLSVIVTGMSVMAVMRVIMFSLKA